MKGTFHDRLERTFETLRKQDITPILKLTGSTGIREFDAEHFTQTAAVAGTPNRFVATAVGSEEHGGAYWDEDGTLRYHYNDSPVTELNFWFPTLGCAAQLVDALEDQGLTPTWDGDGDQAVQITPSPIGVLA